jgi:amidohydrolase
MPDPADLKARARDRVLAERDRLIELSRRIHASPELGFAEERSAAWVAEALAAGGLEVRTGVCDLPTALTADAGTGALRIGVCAEYDALPEIGHACGHNVIAAAAVGAGIALAEVAAAAGLSVRVLGTPSEEGGGGKILMLDRGAFRGVHAAMMVHPGPYEDPEPEIIAVIPMEARYTGREAHASAFPWLGVNAADALTVAQTAVALLRQQLRPTDRIHTVVRKGGGATNVIPAHTAGDFWVRARTLDEVRELQRRVVRCLEAGAVATGATLEWEESQPPYAHMVHDPDLVACWRRNAAALGRRPIEPGDPERVTRVSTDMGNVSLAIPSIHPMLDVASLPAVNHQEAFAAACVGPEAERAIVDGAVAMAWTAIDAAVDERLRARLLGGDEGAAAGRAQASATRPSSSSSQ